MHGTMVDEEYATVECSLYPLFELSNRCKDLSDKLGQKAVLSVYTQITTNTVQYNRENE